MRLLTVTHFYAAHGGGIERVAGHLCRELAAAGNCVEWAASAADASPDDPGVLPLSLNCIDPAEALTGLPMPIPGPRGLVALARAVRRADVVIVHDALYVTSIVAMLAAKWHRRPVVLIQHIAALEFASPVMKAIMKLATAAVTRPMLRAADRVVFISDTVRQAFAGLRLRQPASLLFNGVDTDTFHAKSDDGEAAGFRVRQGLPDRDMVVAFVGRFVTKKGMAVVRETALRQPELTFALAGSGPIDPASWKLDNVRTLGPLPPAEVACLMRSADALLLPSVGEGYPLVVQEALACGLPVITGLDSANADPGASGWLHGVRIDPSDPVGTASRIAPLLDALPDAEARSGMAAYARRTYSWPAMAAELGKICETLTARQPAARAAA